jgi:hypothetical protein
MSLIDAIAGRIVWGSFSTIHPCKSGLHCGLIRSENIETHTHKSVEGVNPGRCQRHVCTTR